MAPITLPKFRAHQQRSAHDKAITNQTHHGQPTAPPSCSAVRHCRHPVIRCRNPHCLAYGFHPCLRLRLKGLPPCSIRHDIPPAGVFFTRTEVRSENLPLWGNGLERFCTHLLCFQYEHQNLSHYFDSKVCFMII